MKFFVNTAYCLAILSVLSIPVLLLLHYNNWHYLSVSSVAVYIITILLVIVFYRFWAKKTNSFILPVSFSIFPVAFFFLMAGMRLILDVKSDPEGWEIFTVPVALFYSFPFLIVTLIISIVYTIKLRKN